ncbi:MAG: hypothetical protein H7246_02675 [Phycisphaerae bacterium]|nr:hypothetical protein [Saprospiraceae bacterium]
MKHGFLLLLILGFQTFCSGQSLLQDAMALKPFFKFDENKKLVLTEDTVSNEAKMIIQKYLAEDAKLDPFTVKATFKDNPYLDMEKAAQNMGAIRGDFSNLGSANQGASPSGFSVSNLADGLARFLVKRTKQELSMAFFEGFKEKIKDDPYLEHFCPFTRAELLLIDSDVYQFNDYLESLREGFTADMSALPGSTESFLRDSSLCPNCEAKPAGKVVTDFLHVAQQMVNGEPPIDMIAYLGEPGSAIQSAPSAEPQLYNMASALRLLNIVSESFRNTASDNKRMPWFTSNEIREQFKDPKVIRIYLGLLWQKVENVQFADDSGTQFALMRNIMKKANTGVDLVDSWRKSIQSLSELTQALQYGLNSSATTSSTAVDDFFSYSQSVTDLLQAVNQTGRDMLGRKKDLIPTDYILLMRQCNSLYFNVRQRNFVGAVSNVIYCLSLLGSDKDNIATMLKYANFMAAIAEASSPEEMERAIELFALPPGSSQMKKQPGRFAVALNAYTGLAGGYEYLNDQETPKMFGALTAPLGLSLSWGLGKRGNSDKPPEKEKDGKDKVYSWGSLGFFVPLIDVGAVTAYRFKDSTAQDLPELTWGNILSPGLYVVYDLPGKVPIAVGYGAQIGPSLRKVTESGEAVNKSGWRHGLFVTVDIPITYFYLGKPKKPKV